MKRIAVFAALAFMVTGLSFAQNSNGSPQQANAASSSREQAESQKTAPRAPSAPTVKQPIIITNPPVVNNHYYGKVYNPPPSQPQTQAQSQAPTTIIIPVPVPAASAPAQQVPQAQAIPAPVPPAPMTLPRRDPRTGYIMQAGPPRRTIRGVLGVERGMVTLTDYYDEVTWFIMGLERYIGLIEGLNIGEHAEIIGYAPNASNDAQERFFQPATLILEGAEYNIAPLSSSAKAWEQPLGSSPPGKGGGTHLVQAGPPVQTVPVQTQATPEAVQMAGNFPYQPIIIQPAPSPRKEKKEKQPWTHPHTSQWGPHYGAMGKESDSSFWNQSDGVWW